MAPLARRALIEYLRHAMERGVRVAWLAVVLAASVAVAPARAEKKEPAAPCVRLQGERQVRGETLCEDVFSCFRPPGGTFDRIGVRRLAPCEGARGAVVLFLPGMHMNGEIAGNNASYDLRLYLAQAGLRVWSLDYRTHAVPAEAAGKDLEALDGWTRERFVDDAAWAAGFVRATDPPGPVHLAGFGFGGAMAYAVAARDAEPVAGLVVLDGVPNGVGLDGAPASRGPALDLTLGRLSFDERQRLLRAVVRNPAGSSPVPGFAKAGTALADVAWTAPGFGGPGGLSAARDGVTDVRILAQLLLTFDRWWPRAALAGDGPRGPKRRVPVLAFASDRPGPEWFERVRAGAEAFGGESATVEEMPLHGHLDLLAGKLAASEVFEPIRVWLAGPK